MYSGDMDWVGPAPTIMQKTRFNGWNNGVFHFPNPSPTGPNTINNAANGLLELAAQHATLLSGLGEISTGTGDNASSQQPTSVVLRPWVNEPDGSVPFDEQQSVVLGAVGATVTVVSMKVPDGYDGVIKAFNWNPAFGGFVDGSGDLVVQLLRNNTPIRNFDNIVVQKGTVGIPRQISPIRVYSGQVFSITVNHVANGLLAGNIVAGYLGYFYPSAS